MENRKLADAIIENAGGQDNISNLQHCVTRLRFKINDNTKVNIKALKELEGVVGVREQGDGIQVIIGQDVDDVFDAINEKYVFGSSSAKQNTDAKQTKKKQNWFMKIMATMLSR